MFNVGDRVVYVGKYAGKCWEGQLATVGMINTYGHVCVHFDNPDREREQSYEDGWVAENFELLPNDAEEMIPDV